MVDKVLCVTECGFKTSMTHGYGYSLILGGFIEEIIGEVVILKVTKVKKWYFWPFLLTY